MGCRGLTVSLHPTAVWCPGLSTFSGDVFLHDQPLRSQPPSPHLLLVRGQTIMGLLISKPIGKLNRISIRALLVIFKKEVIEKKLFNTLAKLARGHRSRGGFFPPHLHTPCPVPCWPSLQESQAGCHPSLGHPTPRGLSCLTSALAPVILRCFCAQCHLFCIWKRRLSSPTSRGCWEL